MKNGMRWIVTRLLVCAFLTGGSGVCVAQNTSSGDLRGTATDKTGAVIQDATVTVYGHRHGRDAHVRNR